LRNNEQCRAVHDGGNASKVQNRKLSLRAHLKFSKQFLDTSEGIHCHHLNPTVCGLTCLLLCRSANHHKVRKRPIRDFHAQIKMISIVVSVNYSLVADVITKEHSLKHVLFLYFRHPCSLTVLLLLSLLLLRKFKKKRSQLHLNQSPIVRQSLHGWSLCYGHT
jgi:hypothetical protein